MRKAQLTIFFILGAVLVLGGIVWWATSLETAGEGEETVSQVGLQSEQRSAQLKEYLDTKLSSKNLFYSLRTRYFLLHNKHILYQHCF